MMENILKDLLLEYFVQQQLFRKAEDLSRENHEERIEVKKLVSLGTYNGLLSLRGKAEN